MFTPSFAPHTPSPSPNWRLVGLVVAVALAHGAVLYAAPQLQSAHVVPTPIPADWSFSTYTVQSPLPAPRSPSATVAPRPTQRSAPHPTALVALTPPPALPARDAPFEAPAPVELAQQATELIASSSTPDTSVGAQSTNTPEPAVALASAAQPDLAVRQDPSERSGTLTNAPTVHVILPPPARLLYDVKGEIKGFPYHVNGELLWATDSKTYHARMEIRHFLLGSRVQTSTGAVSPQGLEPTRFGDKVKSEVAAHFEREKGKVSFSANTPDAPLLPGAQDQLSVLVQLAAMVAAQSEHLRAGTVLPFQAVGPRTSETWKFTVGTTEALTLPGGAVQALHLWRDPVGEFDPKLEVWLSPPLGYLPVRIRLSQRNGDFVDQQWRETAKP